MLVQLEVPAGPDGKDILWTHEGKLNLPQMHQNPFQQLIGAKLVTPLTVTTSIQDHVPGVDGQN